MPERWEMEGARCLPWHTAFQGDAQGEEDRQSPEALLHRGGSSESLRKPRQLEFATQSTREEKAEQ